MRALALTFAVAVCLFIWQPASAQDSKPLFDPSIFGRDLVAQVEKSVIAIWIFQPNPAQGFQGGTGIGSGVIFQALPEENAAYALTNHHVAGDASLLQIELWDNSTYVAHMIATEPGIDTAVIRIENIPPDAYEVAVLGDSDAVQIGEPALAMGAPGSMLSYNTNRSDPSISFGLHNTATMRVVQGKSTNAMRFTSFWAGWKTGLGQQVMTNLPWTMVTQSAVNGGNSGGPLFNAQGECIGLNHAGFNAGATIAQDQNYTIPINFSKNFAFQILDTGTYELPWFGMDIMFPPIFNNPGAVAEFLEKYYDETEIKVYDVRRGSNAEAAGLLPEDVIVEFDGKVFPTVTDLRMYVFSLPIGKTVDVLVERPIEATKNSVRRTETVELQMTVGVKRTYDAEFSV
jgi:S1-C subfamily serine protease